MKFILKIFKGIIIGLANIIPGVSGGTMMVSMGIYDELISSITHLFKQFKKSVLTLLPYAIGMAGGIVGLAFLITHFMDRYPFQTNMLFIGLILGGVPMIWGKSKKGGFHFGKVIAFLLLFVGIICLQYFGGNATGGDVELVVSWKMALILSGVGIIAAATMVIPGVSGSMILMILGFYNPILKAVKEILKAVAHFNMDKILYYLGILVPAALGVVVGIFAVAKLVEWLLHKAEAVTYSAILGLVIASPVVILMISGIPTSINATLLLSSMGIFILGFIGAYLLGKE